MLIEVNPPQDVAFALFDGGPITSLKDWSVRNEGGQVDRGSSEYKRGEGGNPPQDGDLSPTCCCSPLSKTRWSHLNLDKILHLSSIEYFRPFRPTTPASSSCLSTPASPSHLCSTQFPTRSPRHPLMGCQLKGSSAVGDVEEKEKPWLHQAMPQSWGTSPCPMPFSLLSPNNNLIEWAINIFLWKLW